MIEDGLRKYCWLQANVEECDVSTDYVFQTRFNDFYKVRRAAQWRHRYYKLMQASKGNGITFATALYELRDQTGRLEASFASKLVATLDATKPVIDRFVLNNFGLHLPDYSMSNREARTIDLYEKLCSSYAAMMGSPVRDMICDQFRERYPWADITDLKKIDLVLWQMRGG